METSQTAHICHRPIDYGFVDPDFPKEFQSNPYCWSPEVGLHRAKDPRTPVYGSLVTFGSRLVSRKGMVASCAVRLGYGVPLGPYGESIPGAAFWGRMGEIVEWPKGKLFVNRLAAAAYRTIPLPGTNPLFRRELCLRLLVRLAPDLKVAGASHLREALDDPTYRPTAVSDWIERVDATSTRPAANNLAPGEDECAWFVKRLWMDADARQSDIWYHGTLRVFARVLVGRSLSERMEWLEEAIEIGGEILTSTTPPCAARVIPRAAATFAAAARPR